MVAAFDIIIIELIIYRRRHDAGSCGSGGSSELFKRGGLRRMLSGCVLSCGQNRIPPMYSVINRARNLY